MNVYRTQQLRAAALIDSGADAEQIAEVFGWTAKPPPRIELGQSGTTGHDQTLTPRRKRGIINAIRRKLRRSGKQHAIDALPRYFKYTFHLDDVCKWGR